MSLTLLLFPYASGNLLRLFSHVADGKTPRSRIVNLNNIFPAEFNTPRLLILNFVDAINMAIAHKKLSFSEGLNPSLQQPVQYDTSEARGVSTHLHHVLMIHYLVDSF